MCQQLFSEFFASKTFAVLQTKMYNGKTRIFTKQALWNMPRDYKYLGRFFEKRNTWLSARNLTIRQSTLISKVARLSSFKESQSF